MKITFEFHEVLMDDNIVKGYTVHIAITATKSNWFECNNKSVCSLTYRIHIFHDMFRPYKLERNNLTR